MADVILGIAPYLGIHQSHTGALAVLDHEGTFESVHDLPVVRDHATRFFEGAEFRRIVLDALKNRNGRAVMEEVCFLPKETGWDAFAAGVAYGSPIGVLQALDLSVKFVAGRVWRDALRCPRCDQRSALLKARSLFPNVELVLERHDARAKALLIAHWAANWGKVIELPRQMPRQYVRQPFANAGTQPESATHQNIKRYVREPLTEPKSPEPAE
jgi:hypothetical protein